MTNEEKIKSMGTDELANFLKEFTSCYSCLVKDCNGNPRYCQEKYRRWLESEAELSSDIWEIEVR